MENGAFRVLPDHLVVEILARVAAFSMHDLFNAKKSCKILYKLAKKDYIYRRLPIVDLLWRYKKGNALYEKCIKCDNLEALYKKGLFEYASLENAELGMKLLKRATQLGHLGASYVVGLILVGEGGESLEEGVQLLKRVYASRQVVECRKQYLDISGRWKNPTMFGKDRARYDCPMESEHYNRSGWVRDIDYYEDTDCEKCICRAEMDIFYKYCIFVSSREVYFVMTR